MNSINSLKKLPAILLMVTVSQGAFAADWPQWQGPDRNAVSLEKGLLQEWPKEGPSLAWRIDELGGGDSAPAVVGDKLYGMSNRDGKEIVWALSAVDGKEIWATPLGNAVSQRMPQSKEGPGCTPTVEDERLYVIRMGGTVACLNTDGKVLWTKSLTADFGGTAPTWSYRESPLIDGEKLICTPGSTDAMLVALDKNTGDTIWKTGKSSDSNETAAQASASRNRANAATSQKPNVVLSAGSKWRYLDKGIAPNEAWIQTSFSDDKWSEGQAQLGYGDNDEKTRLSNAAEGYPTYYFRKKFTVDDPSALKPLVLRLLRDDGAIVYLNGTEIVRDNVPDGEVKRETFAASTTPVENDFYVHALPKERLVSGENVIAVEVHQASATSSDVSFDLEIREKIASDRPGVAPQRRFGGGGRFGGRRSGAAYSSVIAIDFEGKRQYVQLTASALIGVSATDGKLLWQYDRPANRMGINCSTPIFHDGLVFAASAYGNGGGAIRLVEKTNGEIDTEEVYFTTRMQNHHGGMIVVDGCLYGANGGNGGGFLACLDFKTGDVLWRDRKAPKGSLLLADGRLYLRSEEGEVVLIEPSRDGLIERGRFDQPDRSSAPAWAHPVVANGKLFIRDQGLLLCYDIKAK